jgi:prepilin-type processing-associated H-X9-DG protein
VPTVRSGAIYVTLPTDSSGGRTYAFKTIARPSQFLMLMDSGGSGLFCGGLKSAVNAFAAGEDVRAIDRHLGAVNCLFADGHVELVPYAKIVEVDAVPCVAGNPWFKLY